MVEPAWTVPCWAPVPRTPAQRTCVASALGFSLSTRMPASSFTYAWAGENSRQAKKQCQASGNEVTNLGGLHNRAGACSSPAAGCRSRTGGSRPSAPQRWRNSCAGRPLAGNSTATGCVCCPKAIYQSQAHLVVLCQLSRRHVSQLPPAQLHRVPIPHCERERLAKRAGQRLLFVAGGRAAAAGRLRANHRLRAGNKMRVEHGRTSWTGVHCPHAKCAACLPRG